MLTGGAPAKPHHTNNSLIIIHSELPIHSFLVSHLLRKPLKSPFGSLENVGKYEEKQIKIKQQKKLQGKDKKNFNQLTPIRPSKGYNQEIFVLPA